ncbi:MAG: glycosyltransferase [Dorea formicigenerans]
MILSVEGFPLAVLEAASAGTPVVACNVAGAEEFIEVSGDGMTFIEDDAVDAATCIEKIVSNRDEMVKIGQLFANNSSMERYAECLKRLFQEVG